MLHPIQRLRGGSCGPNREELWEAKRSSESPSEAPPPTRKWESNGQQQALFTSRFDRAAARLVRALGTRREILGPGYQDASGQRRFGMNPLVIEPMLCVPAFELRRRPKMEGDTTPRTDARTRLS